MIVAMSTATTSLTFMECHTDLNDLGRSDFWGQALQQEPVE
jgi:hypothetical protein